jgi:hypothetical protein
MEQRAGSSRCKGQLGALRAAHLEYMVTIWVRMAAAIYPERSLSPLAQPPPGS